jgi:hypothetical protein
MDFADVITSETGAAPKITSFIQEKTQSSQYIASLSPTLSSFLFDIPQP